ncbi:MAG: ABC transporter permease [Planctomycetota bacterium]
MGNILVMARRELGAYFLSPIAYVVLAIFLFTTGLAFGLGTFQPGEEASLRSLCQSWMVLILAIVLPILTMRLISEELRSGTIETLLTSPISESQVVLGKFLGALVFYVVLLATILLYPILLACFGPVDFKLLLCNLFGLFLMGALYIAVGLFFSACTKHQIVAILCSVVVLAIFSFASHYLATKVEIAWVRILLQHLSIQSHFHDFVRGLVDLNHVVFFVTTAVVFLFLAVKKLEMRRWQ